MSFINQLINRLINWSREESGQTLVEYGLIVALISVVAIIALTLVGTNVSAVFNSVGTTLGSTL